MKTEKKKWGFAVSHSLAIILSDDDDEEEDLEEEEEEEEGEKRT